MAKIEKRKTPLSLSQKVDLIKAVQEGLKTRTVLASEFGLSKSSVCDIFKQKEKLLEVYNSGEYAPHRKRMRKSMYTDVEDALLIWLRQSLHLKMPISGPIIQRKAKELALILGHPGFGCSSGWLARFKARHMITFKNNTCEIGTTSGDLASNKWVAAQLPSTLSEFTLDNIFMAHLSGLFWRCLPTDTPNYKDVKCFSGERSEDRLTVFICTNMSGTTKLPLLVVGNRAKLKSFTHFGNLVFYESNDMAWMSSDIFALWLKQVDQKFMEEQRKVAIIVNDSIIHFNTKLDLKAIRLVPIPLTSILHSSGIDIIRSLKSHYRCYLIIDLLASIDAGKEHSLKLLDGLFMLSSAWHRVSTCVIVDAFKLCGCVQNDSASSPPENDHLQQADGNLLLEGVGVSGLSFDDYVSVDDNVSTYSSLFDGETAISLLQGDSGSRVAGVEGEERVVLSNVEEEDEQVVISVQDIDSSVKTLRRFFVALSEDGESLNLVSRLGGLVSEAIVKSLKDSQTV